MRKHIKETDGVLSIADFDPFEMEEMQAKREDDPSEQGSLLVESIQTKLYARYKMLWMLRHGLTVQDIFDQANLWQKTCNEEGIDPQRDEGFSFEDFIEDNGFCGGSLWVCFEEFLGAEYLHFTDVAMTSVLNEKENELYLIDVLHRIDHKAQ